MDCGQKFLPSYCVDNERHHLGGRPKCVEDVWH